VKVSAKVALPTLTVRVPSVVVPSRKVTVPAALESRDRRIAALEAEVQHLREDSTA
jgi:hypothetical protein